MTPRLCTAAAIALLGFTAGARAADEPAGNGDSHGAALVAFDRELKAALTARDPGALALLVKLPLRLNHPDGSITSLDNPRALQTQLALAFPEEVRKAILETSGGFLMRDLVGYPGGVIWVEAASSGEQAPRFRVAVVNLPGADPEEAAMSLAFVCDADRHRVIVEAGAGGKARYRSWNKPRSVLEKPDLEVMGSGDVLGTSGCAHAEWTFAAGKAEITVSEHGCGEEEPPAGSTGELIVTVGGKTTTSWCY